MNLIDDIVCMLRLKLRLVLMILNITWRYTLQRWKIFGDIHQSGFILKTQNAKDRCTISDPGQPGALLQMGMPDRVGSQSLAATAQVSLMEE